MESVNTERRIPPPQRAKSRFYAAPETQVVSYFDEGDQHQPSYGGGGSGGGGGDYLKMLMNAIPGIPGQDYPLYGEIPQTEFSCQGRVFGGFYADPAAQCQVSWIPPPETDSDSHRRFSMFVAEVEKNIRFCVRMGHCSNKTI